MPLELPVADSPRERFRAALLADPHATRDLFALREPEEFAAAASSWAVSRGIAIDAAELADLPAPALAGHPLGEVPLQPGWPPAGWLPVHFAIEAMAVDWAYFGEDLLRRPFYADAIIKVRGHQLNRLFPYRTALDVFLAGAPADPPAPDGLIFHMSRCGSTLTAQMLAACPENRVLSEPAPLDTIVQLPLLIGWPDGATQVRLVQAMVAALAQGRDPAGRLFLKLDSWHTLALPLFRAAFPETPWIYLYREPVEVLVSQMRMRGAQTAPGVLPPQLFGIGPEGETLPDADYIARVLARTSEAVLQGWGLGGGMLVAYPELPDAMATRILPHFGVTPDGGMIARMRTAASRDAKAPNATFQADAEAKRREAGEAVLAAATWLDPVHARLEAMRAG
ncbi:hypothetical protein [Sphingomonas sp.]|uniref:hypothetical protein n=1 Tax=Sphingomonas sp. TaxID=28214 RepID=UPI001B26073D|nr:hypothetical protein [Sphingomonas sp.]MBO9714421.1 hypothetical protein [Sphingomonas sp.]